MRILLADDHDIVRRGLRALLEEQGDIEIVGEAKDGREAVALCERLNPDLVILDISMPELNGIEAAAQVLKTNPRIKVVMMSMYAHESYIIRSLMSGAKGYILKDVTEEDLVPAVRAAMQGRSFFSPVVTQILTEDYVRHLQQSGQTDSHSLLTDREKEILQLLAEGRSNKEVASTLGVALSTVETHRANMMQKLGLRNTAEIVLYAVRKGIVR